MANHTVKTRIQLKNDTEANWNKAIHFIPLQGEVIIYSADDTHPFSRFKIGDGITNVIDLPFSDAQTIDGKSIRVGTTEEWRRQLSYIPKKGDIIIYSDKAQLDDDTVVAGIKIGDGLAYGIDLPFLGDDIAENLLEHMNDMVRHITAAERLRWNNKITCDDTVDEENLILTRN